jgi:hypothetical protein
MSISKTSVRFVATLLVIGALILFTGCIVGRQRHDARLVADAPPA